MYRITVGEKSVDVVLPCYVHYVPLQKSWMTCDEPDAEAVIANFPDDEEETYCDIDYKTARHEGFPVAHIEESVG